MQILARSVLFCQVGDLDHAGNAVGQTHVIDHDFPARPVVDVNPPITVGYHDFAGILRGVENMPVNFDVTAFDPHVGQLDLSGDGVVIGVNIAVFVGQFIKRRRVVIILFVAIVVGQRGFRSQPARQLNFPVGDVQIIIGGAALYQTVQIDITAAQENVVAGNQRRTAVVNVRVGRSSGRTVGQVAAFIARGYSVPGGFRTAADMTETVGIALINVAAGGDIQVFAVNGVVDVNAACGVVHFNQTAVVGDGAVNVNVRRTAVIGRNV